MLGSELTDPRGTFPFFSFFSAFSTHDSMKGGLYMAQAHTHTEKEEGEREFTSVHSVEAPTRKKE